MSASIWTSDSENVGVMLYAPATVVGGKVEDGAMKEENGLSAPKGRADTFSSSASGEDQDTVVDDVSTVLPLPNQAIKREPIDSPAMNISRSSSSSGDGHQVSSRTSSLVSGVDCVTFEMFLEQLKAVADAASPIITHADSDASLPQMTGLRLNHESDNSIIYETDTSAQELYESDGDGTLTAVMSPCPRPKAARGFHQTGKRSFHFPAGHQRSNKPATIPRPPWLHTITSVGSTVDDVPRSQTNIWPSLEELRRLERSPSHKWTTENRLLLAILYRWWDDATDENGLPAIFNSITGLRLRHRTIHQQFKYHMLLYGEAFPELATVYAVPFDDPKQIYQTIRCIIETEAQYLGIELHRRKIEMTIPTAKASFAKAVRTRQLFKSLAKKAARTNLKPISAFLQTTSLGNRAIVGEDSIDTPDIFVDVEEQNWAVTRTCQPSSQGPPSFQGPPSNKCLAFRVWDENSRTVYKDYGFIAELFDRHGPVPPPLAPDDPSNLFEPLANAHLSFRGNCPVFISCVSSLIQLLNHAGKKNENARIAVINLADQQLEVPYKKFHAQQIMQMLQDKGGLGFRTRYKAQQEYMIWGQVPCSAILHVLDVKSLINESRINEFLHLEYFTATSRTGGVAAKLRNQKLVCDTCTIRTMARITALFGLCGKKGLLQHITEFVTMLVDGFYMAAPLEDMYEMGELGMEFAIALGPSPHSLDDIIHAFIVGVENGASNIAHYTRGERSGVSSSHTT